ncbi:hypothetical protein XaplCFBP3123_20980 [Xanthomonas arboricola pv. populi]|nr:hypothetical protein XaplCFBP3123_20980 [Xanthomonas arboricola pv. populi]
MRMKVNTVVENISVVKLMELFWRCRKIFLRTTEKRLKRNFQNQNTCYTWTVMMWLSTKY